jgi:hypothetical protein
VLFDLIFLSLFVSGWLLCGYIPWVVLSVATRGNAGLGNLPLSLFAALIAGLSVPILFRQDGLGVVISLLAAFLASIALLAARRAAAGALSELRLKPPEDPR